MSGKLLIVLAVAGGAITGGCAQAGARDRDSTASADTAAPRTPVHVDSIFPIEEELRRFRAGIPDAPVQLGEGAAGSMAQLVDGFRTALEASDTAALRAMVIDRAEFAYLYYPHTRYVRKPYELAPSLVWFQLQQNGEKGIVRVLRQYAGSSGRLGDLDCEAEPVEQGPNRLWQDCRMSVRMGESREWKRVFGSIVERDGRYKFVSYANDL